MSRCLLLILLAALSADSFAQRSDMVTVRKKNGRIVKTFLAGSHAAFTTVDGRYFDGVINTIENDTIFITEYDIRAMPTRWGVNVVDTAASYLSAVAVPEISRMKISDRQGFSQVSAGRLLMIGGAGYFALNLINGSYLHAPLNTPSTIRTMSISAGAFGLGLLIKRFLRRDNFSRSKHVISYIPMK